MPDLKPCPFCGGKAELFHSYDGYCCVQCTVCYCSTLNFRKEQTSINFWNRRAGEEDKHEQTD